MGCVEGEIIIGMRRNVENLGGDVTEVVHDHSKEGGGSFEFATALLLSQ